MEEKTASNMSSTDSSPATSETKLEHDHSGLDLPSSPIVSLRAKSVRGTPAEHDISTLEWSIEDYTVKRQKWGPPSTILSGLVGSTSSKEATAIIGPSGCGKTTFLECLSLRRTNFRGAVHLNGKPVTGHYFTQLGYVHQHEEFFAHLTVREHLKFHAVNRNGRKKAAQECMAMVDEVIADTGLNKCAETLIGGGHVYVRTGISGGERKRLAIATELLSNPSILLLDEPTSGLDSVMGDLICLLLGTLAVERNRIVMATIHSPSTKMWSYFTNVLIFAGAGGKVAYMGTREGADEFFAKQGFVRGPGANPAEFYLETVSASRLDEATGALLPSTDYLELAKAYKDLTELQGKLRKLPADSSHRRISPTSNHGSSLLTQFRRNMVRSYIDVMRNTTVLFIVLFNSSCLGTLFGMLYYNQIQDSWRNTMCMIFALLVTAAIITLGHVSLHLPGDWTVFMREYYAGANTLLPYFVARSLADIPRIIALGTMLIIAYWMSGFGGLDVHFARYYGTGLVFIAGATSIGYLGSAFSSNPAVGCILSTVIFVPMVLFSRLLYQPSAVPGYLKWCLNVSVLNHTFSAMIGDHCRGRINDVQCTFLLQFLEVNPDTYTQSVINLIVLTIGLRVCAYIIMAIRMTNVIKIGA